MTAALDGLQRLVQQAEEPPAAFVILTVAVIQYDTGRGDTAGHKVHAISLLLYKTMAVACLGTYPVDNIGC